MLDKDITICSIYIPPSFFLKTEHLDSLLKQLPSPYLLLGDFNGHNILWGSKENNSRGEIIEISLQTMIYVLYMTNQTLICITQQALSLP